MKSNKKATTTAVKPTKSKETHANTLKGKTQSVNTQKKLVGTQKKVPVVESEEDDDEFDDEEEQDDDDDLGEYDDDKEDDEDDEDGEDDEDNEDEEEDDDEDDDNDDGKQHMDNRFALTSSFKDQDEDNDYDENENEDQDEDEEEESETLTKSKGTKKKVLGEQDLSNFKDKLAKTGVVYISRVPPHMKPAKMRHLMSQYGEIGRIYLQPEDPNARKRRIRSGGNKKKNFSEGWIEFLDKSIAKRVALSLNGTIIGGKKSSFYHDDMWLLKYLNKFKWHHLTEQLAYENAVRDQKLKAELAQSKKENAFFLENVNKSKMIQEMEARKLAKKRQTEEEGNEGGRSSEGVKKSRVESDSNSNTSSPKSTTSRAFKQKQLLADPEERSGSLKPTTLQKIFATK